ncbi:MAG: rRNA maturation RNase YbeY [Bacteroidota bacterium]
MILFHVEEGGQSISDTQVLYLKQWIETIIAARQGIAGPVNYIFCGDNYLHRINVEYLQHDTLTDIITFPYDHFPKISGDLFISTERVADNAKELGLPYHDELHRVIIHGILHLCGQGDKTEVEANEMRQLEDWALSLRPQELRKLKAGN